MSILKTIKTTNNKMIFPTNIENNTAIQQLESKEKYKKSNCDNEELEKQRNLLKQVILSNGKQDFFTVFNMECNVGKTYTAIHTIPYYFEAINKGLIEPKGILIVIREIDEGNKYEKKLNELYPMRKVALAFNSDKYKSKKVILSKMYKSDLIMEVDKIPIVIITHENYLRMALDTKLRKTFTKNRRLLIIDETIDICKTLTIKNNRLKEIMNKLQDEEKSILSEIYNPIQEKFEELDVIDEEISNKVFNFKVDKGKYLKLIKKFYKTVKSLYINPLRDELLDILTTIECIYTDTCLINKGKKKEYGDTKFSVSAMNRKQQMWTLDNNIILDASATLNSQYRMNPQLYFLMNNKPVLDHSKWNMEYIYYGSTKSAKGLLNNIYDEEQEEKTDKFYKGCSEVIKDLGENETLVVCTKSEHIKTDSNGAEHIETDSKGNETPYNPYEVFDCNIPVGHIQHFGNITGKNDYGNLKNVLITHTINYSETDYILKYMYFTGKRYADDTTKFKSYSESNLGGIYVFKDREVQEFKEKTIANHFYQAICRVNREMEHNTKAIIISKYLGAILYVSDMLNCKCKQTNKYDSVFNYGENEVNKERHENSKSSKMKKLFTDIISVNIPQNIKYQKLDNYIIQINREEIQKYLTYDDNKFSKSIYDCKDFMKENSILYFKKNFVFVLDSPLL